MTRRTCKSGPGGAAGVPRSPRRTAEEKTRRALADPAVPAIYEAAFTWNDVRIRADVLVRVASSRTRHESW